MGAGGCVPAWPGRGRQALLQGALLVPAACMSLRVWLLTPGGRPVPANSAGSLVFPVVIRGFLAWGICRPNQPDGCTDVAANRCDAQLVSEMAHGYEHRSDQSWKAQLSSGDPARRSWPGWSSQVLLPRTAQQIPHLRELVPSAHSGARDLLH